MNDRRNGVCKHAHAWSLGLTAASRLMPEFDSFAPRTGVYNAPKHFPINDIKGQRKYFNIIRTAMCV